MNVINGGAHADNKLDLQEFMIVPHGFSSFSEALRAGAEIFHHLKAVLKKKGYSTAVGDEGGFAPDLKSSEEALATIVDATRAAGYKPGTQVSIALDPAASELHDGRKYVFKKSGERLEDLGPDDRDVREVGEGLPHHLHRGRPRREGLGGLGQPDRRPSASKIQLVGDDIFVTNPKILAEGIAKGIGNSILIKVNQIGTLTETLDCMALAARAGYTCMVSHRSGETEDTTIADLAVATSAGQIKTGSASRSDRIAKYNQLLRIEEELGPMALFAGKAAFNPERERSCKLGEAARHKPRAAPAPPRRYSSSWSTVILRERRNFLSRGVIRSGAGSAFSTRTSKEPEPAALGAGSRLARSRPWPRARARPRSPRPGCDSGCG